MYNQNNCMVILTFAFLLLGERISYVENIFVGRNIQQMYFFITMSVFAYFIEKMDNVIFQVVILLILLFVEIAWVEFEHQVMKKKMIKRL